MMHGRSAEALKRGVRGHIPMGKGRREGVNITKRSEKWDRSAGYRRTEVFHVITTSERAEGSAFNQDEREGHCR